MKINPSKFGSGLSALRKTRGLSQAAISETSDLSINYISLIENGAKKPSLDAINKLAEAMDIPAQFLVFLGGDDADPDGPFSELIEATREAIYIAVAEDQKLSQFPP